MWLFAKLVCPHFVSENRFRTKYFHSSILKISALSDVRSIIQRRVKKMVQHVAHSHRKFLLQQKKGFFFFRQAGFSKFGKNNLLFEFFFQKTWCSTSSPNTIQVLGLLSVNLRVNTRSKITAYPNNFEPHFTHFLSCSKRSIFEL